MLGLRCGESPRFRGWTVACVGAAITALAAGCASRSPMETARQVIDQQRQEQAMLDERSTRDQSAQAGSQPDMLLSLIAEAQRRGRYFASLAYIESYTQQFGSQPRVEALRADALRMTGQSQRSEAAYRSLIASGQAAHGWHGLGLLAGARGDFAQATQYLRRAAQAAPTDAQILGDLGFACLSSGDLPGARLPLGQAAELDPGNPRVLSNLALLLELEGDSVGAKRVMDQANISEEGRRGVYALSARLRSAVHAPAYGSSNAGSTQATGVARSNPGVALGFDGRDASDSPTSSLADRFARRAN